MSRETSSVSPLENAIWLSPILIWISLSMSPLILIRTKTDLAWNALESRDDLMGPLEFHFPEICWQENSFQDRSVWYLGVHLLSPLTTKTRKVIQRALENLSHQSSSLVRNRKRLLYLAFYSESDMNIFRFNLNHFGKMVGTYCESFPSTRPEFQEGYPGMSGFIEENYRAEATTIGR